MMAVLLFAAFLPVAYAQGSDKTLTQAGATISAPKLTPSAGYAPESAKKLKIQTSISALTSAADVYAAIYTSSGKWVADTAILKKQSNGSKTLYWDGKVSSGNKIGLKKGKYAPAGSYKIKIVARQSSNTAVQWSSAYTAIKLCKLPAAATPSVTPSGTYGFYIGWPNTLKITSKISTPLPATVKAEILNAKNKLVATTAAAANQKSGNVSVYWDGKATKDNKAGLKAGAYAPASSGGTAYYVRFNITNDSMGGAAVLSKTAKFKVYSGLKITSASVSPASFTAGTGKTAVSFKLTKMSNVAVKIYDTSFNKIFAVLNYSWAKPNTACNVYWDGKATAGNTAGLAKGALVPAGSYRVQVFAANTSVKLSTVLNVSSSYYEVHNATELFKAIRSNATIKLLPGDSKDAYNLGVLDDMTQTANVYFDDDYYGPVIKNISNLKIYADSTKSLYIMDDLKVLTLDHCSNVTILKVQLGHSRPVNSCDAGVVATKNCTNIKFDYCDLYGCGTDGIWMDDCNGITISNSNIRDCVFNAAGISKSNNIVFNNVKMYGMAKTYGSDLMHIYQSTSVKLIGCNIYNNGYSGDTEENYLFHIDDASAHEVYLENCTIADTNLKYDALSNGPIVMKQNGEYLVHNARELFYAIRPDATIKVLDGDYNLDLADSYTNTYVGYDDGMKFRSVYNLKIYSTTNELLYSENSYGVVAGFETCDHITLQGLTLGHTVSTVCFAPVVYGDNSDNMTFNSCDLYGCGTEAYFLGGCNNITVSGGKMRDCSHSAFSLEGCKTVNITGVEIRNNGNNGSDYTLADLYDCDQITLSGCDIYDNGALGNTSSMFSVTKSTNFSYDNSDSQLMLDNIYASVLPIS
jgi:flagellar hook assembly protein FlgD